MRTVAVDILTGSSQREDDALRHVLDTGPREPVAVIMNEIVRSDRRRSSPASRTSRRWSS